MTDETALLDSIHLLTWALGGFGVIALAGYGYLVNSISAVQSSVDRTQEDLSKHKTSVAENYLSKMDFNNVLATLNENSKRVERRIDEGTKANLESNEKIRSEISNSQTNLINLITNMGKTNQGVNPTNADILAAIAQIPIAKT